MNIYIIKAKISCKSNQSYFNFNYTFHATIITRMIYDIFFFFNAFRNITKNFKFKFQISLL